MKLHYAMKTTALLSGIISFLGNSSVLVQAQEDEEYFACSPISCSSKRVHKPVDVEEYYATASNLTGDALKFELNDIIRDHQVYSYTPCVWAALADLDADEENPGHVIGIYTERSIPVLRRDCGKNDGDSWNREHIWAKSKGFPNRNQDAYTDLHHLRVADKSVNGDRSNFDFKIGGNAHPECIVEVCRVGENSFEPPDNVKGEVARMLFYMAVRYEGNDDSNVPDLEIVDRSTSKGEPHIGYLSNLKEWHCKFPVSEKERKRNDKVHAWQGNRNFAIDHPEYVESIWNFSCADILGASDEL